MKRLFNHLVQILILGAIFFFMIKLPVFKIPYIQEILTGLIFLLLIIFMGILVYKKKTFHGFLLALILLTGNVSNAQVSMVTEHYRMKAEQEGNGLPTIGVMNYVNSGQYCLAAEQYDKHLFEVSKYNWRGDVACLDNTIENVRNKLNKLKISPSVFRARDKLTYQQMTTYRSFRQDSHWNEWVKQYFTESAKSDGSDPEELACAAKLASLCSEYDLRHPQPKSLTVKAIIQADNQTVGCWPCKMSYIILSVVQDLSSHLESKMQNSALRILSIFFLIWILYATFLAVVFPSKASNFLKDFMTRLLCVMIVALFLASGDNLKALYKTVLTPIVELGMGLTQEIDQAIKVNTTFATDVENKVGVNFSVTNYCLSASPTTGGTSSDPYINLLSDLGYRQSSVFKENQSSTEAFLTPELQVALLCMTQNMYRQVSPITAVGQSLIGFAQTESRIPANIGPISFGFSFPNFIMWIVGFILVILFSIFGFVIAFKIIDIFLRFGFVLVLMPLFVMTWAFPATRDFTKKGFLFLMNVVTEFLGLSLAINFIIVLFETGIASNKDALLMQIGKDYYKDYGKDLLNIILSNGGWYFLFMIIALFFLGMQVLSVSTKIIASLFGTKAIGGDIMGAVAVSAIQTAGKLGKKAWDVGSYSAENAEPYQPPQRLSNFAGGGSNQSASAASKRYFGQQAGEGLKRGSQTLAAGIDKVGVGVGQALSKTGIGAIVGVPLTLGAKTLSLGVRAAGKVGSGAIKVTGRTTGAVAKGIRHPVQTTKNGWNATKTGAKNAWDKATSGPKKVWGEIKRGFNRGNGE